MGVITAQVFPQRSAAGIAVLVSGVQSQNEILERWILTAGFGFTRETSKTISPAGGTTKAPARSSDVSPNLALVYKLTRRVSLYTSYSNSFTLPDPTLEDAQGRRFWLYREDHADAPRWFVHGLFA